MFNFLIRKQFSKSTQRFIDRLNPKVYVYISTDLPIPSLQTLKRMCKVVAKINSFEEKIKKLSDQELRAKTDEFKGRYVEGMKIKREEFRQLKDLFDKAEDGEDKETQGLQLDKAWAELKKKKQEVLKEISKREIVFFVIISSRFSKFNCSG